MQNEFRTKFVVARHVRGLRKALQVGLRNVQAQRNLRTTVVQKSVCLFALQLRQQTFSGELFVESKQDIEVKKSIKLINISASNQRRCRVGICIRGMR